MPERNVITALTGTAGPLLTCDTQDYKCLAMSSLFLAREWKKTTPYVTDDLQIQPNNQSGLGIEMQFELPKLATFIIDMILQATLPPITVTPVGNPASYIDTTGFALIDFFRINFGANLLYSREKYDLYFYYRYRFPIDLRNGINMMILGDTTTAQRSAALLNGITLLIPLWLPFSVDTLNALPLVVLSQKTRFTFRSEILQNFTFTPIPGTILTFTGLFDFLLLITVIHTTTDESRMIMDMSRDDDGISYMIHQNVRQESDDLANSASNASFHVKLSAMTKPLQCLYWGLVPTRLTNNSGFNDRFMFGPQPIPVPPGMNPYNPLLTWDIIANSQIIQRIVSSNYIRLWKHIVYFPSPVGDFTYFQTYTECPIAENASLGYLDYTNLNNPVLNINMGVGGTGLDPIIAGAPQSLRLIVNATDYNFWFFKSGNWSRAFN